MTCISITLKLTLSTIIYQVVLLASKPNFSWMRMNFSTERCVASFYPQELFELNVHKSLERTLAFSKCSE